MKKNIFLIIITLVLGNLITIEHIFSQNCGADANSTGNPIGGGKNYINIIDTSVIAIFRPIVKNKEELLFALENAKAGQIIYISDTARINLRGCPSLLINSEITLASGRGKDSEGALLFWNGMWEHPTPMIKINGNKVRITGLRIQGPALFIGVHKIPGPTTKSMPHHHGIICEKYHNLQVDNCEIWGWTYGIELVSSLEARIHHNYIHHCLSAGLGYGISHRETASSIIEANLFNANRHSIAGSGDYGQKYTAKYNIVGPNGTGHAFDMHCSDLCGGTKKDPCRPCQAGDLILISQNTFYISKVPSIKIRGKPTNKAIIANNKLTKKTTVGNAFLQTLDKDKCCKNTGNFELSSTCPTGLELDTFTIILNKKDGFHDNGIWSNDTTNELEWIVGDFNGDCKDDIAKYVDKGPGITEDGVYLFLSNGSSFDKPVKWTIAGKGKKEWFIGNFDGKSGDDLARFVWYKKGDPRNGVEVLLSNGKDAFGPAVHWTNQGYGETSWIVGDFDGDGKSDLARQNNYAIEVLISKGTKFEKAKTWIMDSLNIAKVKEKWYVGDFNGDGADDIFKHPASNYCTVFVYLSDTATSSFKSGYCWSNVETNEINIAQTYKGLGPIPDGQWYVGDFNGDGGADIFRYLKSQDSEKDHSGAEVFLSNKNNEFIHDGNWTNEKYSEFYKSWKIGDFNGDGLCDLLTLNKSIREKKTLSKVFLSWPTRPISICTKKKE